MVASYAIIIIYTCNKYNHMSRWRFTNFCQKHTDFNLSKVLSIWFFSFLGEVICVTLHYLNIIVQGQNSNFWSLRLALRLACGILLTEKCIQLLEEKLEKHELNLHTDIVAIITDGSSVMTKVDRLINIDQQLCFAHGVQLGSMEVV